MLTFYLKGKVGILKFLVLLISLLVLLFLLLLLRFSYDIFRDNIKGELLEILQSLRVYDSIFNCILFYDKESYSSGNFRIFASFLFNSLIYKFLLILNMNSIFTKILINY